MKLFNLKPIQTAAAGGVMRCWTCQKVAVHPMHNIQCVNCLAEANAKIARMARERMIASAVDAAWEKNR